MDLTVIRAKNEDSNQDSVYKTLLLNEKQRKASRRLKKVLGKDLGEGFAESLGYE